jgi:hypothetical protein
MCPRLAPDPKRKLAMGVSHKEMVNDQRWLLRISDVEFGLLAVNGHLDVRPGSQLQVGVGFVSERLLLSQFLPQVVGVHAVLDRMVA